MNICSLLHRGWMLFHSLYVVSCVSRSVDTLTLSRLPPRVCQAAGQRPESRSSVSLTHKRISLSESKHTYLNMLFYLYMGPHRLTPLQRPAMFCSTISTPSPSRSSVASSLSCGCRLGKSGQFHFGLTRQPADPGAEHDDDAAQAAVGQQGQG